MFKRRRRRPKKILVWSGHLAAIALASAAVAVFVVSVDPLPNFSGGTTTTALTTPTLFSTTTTTTALGSTTTAPPQGGLIYAGPSRNECLTPATIGGGSGLSYLQSLVSSFETETGTTVSCLSSYLSGAPTWSNWEHPWIDAAVYGYSSWVAEAPQSRQLILEVDLIPSSLENKANPLKWERTCAGGGFNSHATELGNSLVAAGLGHSVIRLGAEMNGKWEPDFMGPTAIEQKMWATCFDNEVISMRRALGEHFLFDWNPNACKGDYPYGNFYPGSAYVDIVGLDLYDVGCETPRKRLTFGQLANEPAGLAHFEAFAAAKRKPMSLPEWGLSSIPSGDDPEYIDGIGTIVDTKDFAFETYFDASGPHLKALPLGRRTPLSLAAFRQWFG